MTWLLIALCLLVVSGGLLVLITRTRDYQDRMSDEWIQEQKRKGTR
jgi:hypothetical protein